MKKTTSVKQMLWLLVLPMFFLACEDKMDEHYEVPGWLKGSAWEVLEGRGNYTIFLKGAELAGFKPILEGKSILTVMAPDDAAFESYLKAHNYASIEAMEDTDREKLIGFHLMYYSYSPDKLINFSALGDGATEEEKEQGAGLNYKYRTKSSDAPSLEEDTVAGQFLTIYHQERYLPVFSYRFFKTKGIDAAYNYEYFYPGSTWTGDNLFNVSNASVVESGIITDNGYLYTIDKVLEPLETIYTVLKDQSDFSSFFELYDSYRYFTLDDELTEEYGNGTELYRHCHMDPLPNIAWEWYSSSYFMIQANSRRAYSVFAPSNKALEDFLKNYWTDYNSLKEVNPIALRYLLYNCFYNSDIVFPEEIKSGEVLNAYDSKIEFDVDKVPEANRKMCVNGAFYGVDVLEPPVMFSSVTGPAFRYKGNSYYLNMLDGTGLLEALSSSSSQFVALIPSDAQMQHAGITIEQGRLQEMGEDGMSDMSKSAMVSYVNMHISNKATELTTTGTLIIKPNHSYKYWFVKDGKITTSVLFNNQIDRPNSATDPFVAFHEVKNNDANWTNGKVYIYDNQDMYGYTEDGLIQYKIATLRDPAYKFYQFGQLLRDAGLVANNAINPLFGDQAMFFIPTNEAIQNALNENRIPGITNGSVTNQAELRAYLFNYFLLTADNNMGDYFYIGSDVKGKYKTVGNKEIELFDEGSKLSIQLEGGNKIDVVSTYNYFPFAYPDGGVQFIEEVL